MTARRDESGAVLILALAFILTVSLIVLALTTWATSDLNNTSHFNSATALDYAASGITDVAIQSIGTNPIPTTTPASSAPTGWSYCWNPSPSNVSETNKINRVWVAVWCNTQEYLDSPNTRVVTIVTCKTSLTSSSSKSDVATAATNCVNHPLLSAVVTFDDYPPGGGPKLLKQCTPPSCGYGTTVNRWVWGGAAGSSASNGTSVITITSTAPSSAAVGGSTYTPTATASSFDTVIITTLTPAVCTLASGVVTFIGVGTCDIAFNDSGNSNYSPASQVTQSFSVGQGTNTITVTSTAPLSATVGGATYTPTATATSGAVVITSATTAVCTISAGVVHFVASGTCTLNFNDAGNANYSAAAQQQQIFTVSGATSGTYPGSTTGNIPSSNTYFLINGASAGSGTSTANPYTPGAATTLTRLTFTIDSTSGASHVATVGIITGGVWSATALTCTIAPGSTSCLMTLSISVPAGSSLNVRAVGNNHHSGSWAVMYTQP